MIYRFRLFVFIFGLFFSLSSFSQTVPFNIAIEPLNISGLGGLQSYAFGQNDGKWLVVGGRLDGLHRRQPWASFDIAGHNNQLIVIDPVSQQKWSASLTTLPATIQEQLSSTNMEFIQEGDYLYCLGGYGYSSTTGDHTTFEYLTAIKVPDVISAIINGTEFQSFFRQITDSAFQVTGGRLKKIDSKYYLLGGQKFIGRYNPMGPNHGPGFIQEYTNEIRIFTLTDDGANITIDHLPSYTDSSNLHRRDYNAESQIMPNEEEGITLFSGVFRPDADLPFLNCVNVDSGGYVVNDAFQQYYNHYHCPVLPLYSALDKEMHTVFFGGIAQYYDDGGTLVQDDNVPFVKTIANVTRDSNGIMTEIKLPIEMPALLGAGAEFIPNLDLAHFNNGVFQLDNITADSTLIGYIYGGISSTGPNIFFTNTGTQSNASSQIFKVYLSKNTTTATEKLDRNSTETLTVKLYPNPTNSTFRIDFHLLKSDDVKISILNNSGSLIETILLKNQPVGKNTYSIELDHLSPGGTYLLRIETASRKSTQKLIFTK